MFDFTTDDPACEQGNVRAEGERGSPAGVHRDLPSHGDLSPCVVLDNVPYPLAAGERNDPSLLDQIVGVLSSASTVRFEMGGLFRLAPTFAGRLIAGLVDVLARMTRWDHLQGLFEELLGLDPGSDRWHAVKWESALVEVATAMCDSERGAQHLAKQIVQRAKQLGIPKIAMSKICHDIAVRARRVCGERFRRPPGEHLYEPNADAGPAGKYHDPLAYLQGEFRDHLWHDGSGTGYISVRARNFRIGSSGWSNWLRSVWYEAHTETIKEESFRGCMQTLSAVACQSKKFELANRIGRHGDKIFFDLVNDDNEVVEISADGWKIVAGDCPLKFVRNPFAGTLPRPEGGGSIEALRPSVNLSEQDFRCFVASIFDALKGRGEYLVTAILGEKGSAKSTITRVGVRLIDPHRLNGPNDVSDLTGLPKGEDDLAVLGCNHHLAAFDNVGRITDEMSDALCRFSTGGSVTKRKLYTDGDLVRLSYCGPVLMNGITDIITRGDLADRSVILRAEQIATRISSEEFWCRFRQEQPQILGALFDAVAAGLASEAAGPIPASVPLPRMAASATWIYRCFAHLGWSYTDWYEAVTQSQTDVDLVTIEGSELGKAMLALWNTLNHDKVHRDTPSGWHQRLLHYCPLENRRYFPSIRSMRGALTALAPALRLVGLDVRFTPDDRKENLNGSKQRVITIQAFQVRKVNIEGNNLEYSI